MVLMGNSVIFYLYYSQFKILWRISGESPSKVGKDVHSQVRLKSQEQPENHFGFECKKWALPQSCLFTNPHKHCSRINIGYI